MQTTFNICIYDYIYKNLVSQILGGGSGLFLCTKHILGMDAVCGLWSYVCVLNVYVFNLVLVTENHINVNVEVKIKDTPICLQIMISNWWEKCYILLARARVKCRSSDFENRSNYFRQLHPGGTAQLSHHSELT